ncbi:MAG: hypothetical protein Ct9H300mP8_02060 [Gammaproteobacteria bacterium]|nr:MAG: hypothetical protein Ct9H300mP8_02060 [Gammaproteobacteria bacterium]
MLAHDLIVAGAAQTVVGRGNGEHDQCPYLLAKARGGFRMGHGEIFDSMFTEV